MENQQAEFGNLTDKMAKQIVVYWMKTFSERHKDLGSE